MVRLRAKTVWQDNVNHQGRQAFGGTACSSPASRPTIGTRSSATPPTSRSPNEQSRRRPHARAPHARRTARLLPLALQNRLLGCSCNAAALRRSTRRAHAARAILLLRHRQARRQADAPAADPVEGHRRRRSRPRCSRRSSCSTIRARNRHPRDAAADVVRAAASVKTALITGITGQDGSYLAELLLAKGYRVVGMTRRTSTDVHERIQHIVDEIEFVLGRPARPELDHRDRRRACGPTRSKPRRAIVRPDVLGPAGAHRRIHRARRDARARGDPRRRSGDPVLPGVEFRDVRQGPGRAAGRAHRVLSALALRRRQSSTGIGSRSTTASPTISMR